MIWHGLKPIQYSTVVKSGDFLFIQTFNLKLLKLNKQNNCKTQKLSSYKNLKFCCWLKFHICPHTNYPQKAEIEDQGNKALLFHTSPVSFLFFLFFRQFSHLGTPQTIGRMSASSHPKISGIVWVDLMSTDWLIAPFEYHRPILTMNHI